MAKTTEISNTDDVIDLRDVTDRFEELETELEDACTGQSEENSFDDEWVNATADDADHALQDSAIEYRTIKALLEELCGSGGDHQWRGDWYPGTMIRDSYFVDAMRELVQDIGDLPKDIPGYLAIDWDKTAENLRADYSSVDFDGAEYWYR